MLHLFYLFMITLLISAAAQAEIVYDSRGFEDSMFKVGPLEPMDGWRPGVASPDAQIVDLEDGTFRKVLRLFSPESPGNANHSLEIPPIHRGALIISFDAWTNTDFRTLYLLATVPDATASDLFDTATVSMCWGAVPGTIGHYAGRWIELGPYEMKRWHHVDVIIHLSGPKAGLMDVNLDGGKFEGVDLPWRNRFTVSPQNPIGKVWFIGYGRPASRSGGSEQLFVQIDNVVITHAPEFHPRKEDNTSNTIPLETE